MILEKEKKVWFILFLSDQNDVRVRNVVWDMIITLFKTDVCWVLNIDTLRAYVKVGISWGEAGCLPR